MLFSCMALVTWDMFRRNFGDIFSMTFLVQTKTSLTCTHHQLYIRHKRTGRTSHDLAFISQENIRKARLGKASSCFAKLWLTITGMIYIFLYFGKNMNILWIPSCLYINNSELRQLIWQLSDVHITDCDSTCNYVTHLVSIHKFNNGISSSTYTRYRPSFLVCQKIKRINFLLLKNLATNRYKLPGASIMLSCKEGKPEGYSIFQANPCGSSKLDMCFV